MAKKVVSKKVKPAGMVDYWFGTITAAVIIGTSVQYLLGTLSSYITPWFSSNDSLYGEGGMPNDFLIAQLVTAVIGVVVGVALLMIRKPKP